MLKLPREADAQPASGDCSGQYHRETGTQRTDVSALNGCTVVCPRLPWRTANTTRPICAGEVRRSPKACRFAGAVPYDSVMFAMRMVDRIARLKRYLLGIAAVLVGVCGIGCSGDVPGSRFFPLVPGQSWQYQVQRTTMDGVVQMRHILTTLPTPAADSAVTAIRESIAGHRYAYLINESGTFRVSEDAEAKPEMVLPHTLEADTHWRSVTHTSVLENSGAPWESLFRIEQEIEMTYRVEALNASVSTPAGEFSDCVIVSGYGKTSANVGNYIGVADIEVNSREWFAPGVGLVRMERQESTTAEALAGGSLTMVLDHWDD